MPERELTVPYTLAGPGGRLNSEAVGWSRIPLCDAALPGPAGRRKRWNFWSFTSPELLFVVSVVDVDYLRVVFAQALNLAERVWHEGRLTLPLLGRPRMGARVADDVVFAWGRTRIEMLVREGGVDVSVEWPGFSGGDLLARLRVALPPGHESINVTIPWSQTRYHFTSKQPALPVVGTVRLGETTYIFDGSGPRGAGVPGDPGAGPSDCFAALDFARGLWRYDSTWDWLTASGRDGRGRVVGLNLGAGWTDGTPMTENGLVIDGVASKLAQTVSFERDARDLMRPWRVRSRDGGAADGQRGGGRTVDLEVEPFYHHRLDTNLGILRSKLDQVVGRVGGTVRLPGDTVTLDGVLAMCEDQKARW